MLISEDTLLGYTAFDEGGNNDNTLLFWEACRNLYHLPVNEARTSRRMDVHIVKKRMTLGSITVECTGT